MPKYDFRCSACSKLFEVTRSMGQTGDECCPDCGAVANKVFSPVGVAFKGTGFHNTDYRPKPKDESAPAPCAAASDSSPACASCPAASTD
jgi:putative FmdB family regulatory protein